MKDKSGMSSNGGSSATDFVRRVVRNVGEQLDRLETLPEDQIPDMASALGVNANGGPASSYAAQVACGAITGGLIGYSFGKVSKAAALAVGGGILLVQTGVHMGYMSLSSSPELGRLTNRQDTAVQVRANMRSIRNRIEPYLHTNPAFLSSLIAGLCLGYGIS